MNIERKMEFVKSEYAAYGVDVEAALKRLDEIPVSIHCWQGDDVKGFEDSGVSMSGGIQVTGNHPGRARNVDDLRSDLEKMLSYIPGTNKINLHASYREASGQVDRNNLQPVHFDGWIDWARDQGVGLDFNGTYFSHPLSENGYTLSNRDPAIRAFWIEHGMCCEAISEHIGAKLRIPCINDLWIPDGEKETPVDSMVHRELLIESLDKILANRKKDRYHKTAVESKLFGIGSEAYVVGSHEFYLSYALTRDVMLTLDVGHYHPTETVSSKLSALLPFLRSGMLLHLSRPVRWDSDHVVLLDDETRAIMRELARLDALDKVHLATDFFDGSINRVIAWGVGIRSAKKALLEALLQPLDLLKAIEQNGERSKRLALTEELKVLPVGTVWDVFCEMKNVPTGYAWIEDALNYEKTVLAKRG